MKTAKTMEEHTEQIWANKLNHILGSDNFSDDIKNTIRGIILMVANEANMGCFDEPEMVKVGFPIAMRKIERNYRRAIIHSLEGITEAALDASQEAELNKYEVRFDTGKLHKSDAPEENQIDDLADLLSKVMKHPEMPTRLFNMMADEISEVPNNWRTPENISFNLQEMRKAEN